jgi:phospholipid/cholesterol/gamma-HCH transport system substrate-binding protein
MVPSERTVRVMTGLVAIVFGAGAVTFGVKVAGGALRPVYHLHATFSAAGQGLARDSDVKVHGVNIGRVTKVALARGRAEVTMEIRRGERIPVDARATIRPKTLFGEKFVDIDPGPREVSGPFLPAGGRITRTLAGFELERVLADAYPILQAVDPAELAVILDTLAEGARGTGPAVNRQIANFAAAARVAAAHDADTRRFLEDLAAIAEELDRRAADAGALARDLDAALPALNDRGDRLAELLVQAARLSADAADVLEVHRPLLRKTVTEGGKALELLAGERARIPPLVTGLRQFVQVLGEATDHPELTANDGTRMAAIKLIMGGPTCGRTSDGCGTAGPAGAPAPQAPPAAVPLAAVPPGVPRAPSLPLPALPVPTTGVAALVQLIGGLL